MSLLAALALLVASCAESAERARAARLSGPPPPEGFELLAVDASSGEPVPDARIFVVMRADRDERLPVTLPSLSLRAGLRIAGTPYRADAEGRALLPCLPEGEIATVFAESGDLYGSMSVKGYEPGPVRLELDEEEDLEVRVVDPDGEPVSGVRVALLRRLADDARVVDLRTSAGGSGIARFEYLDRKRRWYEARGTVTGAAVAIGEPLGLPVELDLDLFRLPDGPLTLALPETGEVEVRVVDERGDPVDEGLRFELAAGAVAESKRGAIERAPHGRKLYRGVGLGLELQAGVARPDAGSLLIRSFAGPRRAGERAVVELVLPDEVPSLVGRFVDEDGAPLASTRVWVRVDLDSLPREGRSLRAVRTDELGRFRIGLRGEPERDSGSGSVVLESREVPGRARYAHVELTEVPSLRETDLGDVELALAPLVASGRVVDADGAPVELARVRLVTSLDRYPVEAQRTAFPEPEMFDHTGPDGRFEVRGPLRFERELDLVVQRRGLVPRPSLRHFLPGDRDLLVEMDPSGELAGSVLLDPEVPPTWIEVRLEWTDLGPEDPATARLELDGRFELPSLRPGTARVVVELWRGRGVLATIDDIAIVPGEPARHPRLQEIDLRGAIAHARLVPVDEEGAPLYWCPVEITRPILIEGETPWPQLEPLWPIELIAPGESFDLAILCEGYRTVRLESVRGTHTVEMVEAPASPLRVGPEHLVAPPFEVSLEIVPPGEVSFAHSSTRTVDLDDEGRGAFHAPEPGRYQAYALVRRLIGEDPYPESINEDSLQFPVGELEVLDATEPQVFELEMPAEAIDAQLAKILARR